MKNIIVIYTLAMASAVCFMACEKQEKGGLGEGRVQGVDLRAPINGSTVTLAENGDGLQFKWSEATVSNGTLAFYTVVFDKASGDFSQPIMSRRPDKLGSATILTVPRMTLDSLARAVGATVGNPVDIKWTVHASTGINGAVATQPFTLKLEVTQDQQGDMLMTAADQMMDALITYFLDGMPLDIWGEYYPRRNTYWDGASTVWGQGAAFSGYTALKVMGEHDPALKAKYATLYDNRLLTSIDKFRNQRQGGPEGYAVFPGGGDERFYDDNVWIGLDMVDLYMLTGDTKYLERAKLVWNFVLSGTNDLMGGGVHWKEGDKGKNTCSTAPAAVLGAKLYQATNEQVYLDRAKEFYHWVKDRLRDPEDKLYWDNIKLSDPNNPGSAVIIDKTKFTYNAGQPVQAAVLLYEITGDNQYLTDARETAEAAYKRWFKPYHSSALGEEIVMWTDNNVWFNAILLRGYIELCRVDKDEKYVQAYRKIMQHAWMSPVRDAQTNLLNNDFKATAPRPESGILYQGACVEMLARLGDFEAKKL
jgi:rhamnogalacturonyl hydrolase YesR